MSLGKRASLCQRLCKESSKCKVSFQTTYFNHNFSFFASFCMSYVFLPCGTDLRVEGLFRVPGNSVRQQILRDALNNGTDVDLESGEFHSNDVATLLKMFLGELPEPLLTHKHFHAHLKIAGEYGRVEDVNILLSI